LDSVGPRSGIGSGRNRVPIHTTTLETSHDRLSDQAAQRLARAPHEPLRAHDTEIEFVNLAVDVPVTSDPSTKHAPWKLNGVIRIRNEKQR
jgi:hypothetical protein